MLKIIGFLFPWRRTFRRLRLEAWWWHRLAVVLFSLMLMPAFLFSWVLGDEGSAPVNSHMGGIQNWAIIPAPLSGFVLDQDAGALTSPPDAQSIGQGRVAIAMKDIFDSVAVNVNDSDKRKTVQMPDGKTATYPGTTSDDTIKAEWRHKLYVAKAQAALFGFGIAVLVSLILSYLLQAIYRAALYVIYGAGAVAETTMSKINS